MKKSKKAPQNLDLPQDPQIETTPTQTDQKSVKNHKSRRSSNGLIAIFLPKVGKPLRMNHYMFYSCIFVVLLFFGMIGYMIHFMISDRDSVITNPYNQRTENLRKQIKRGEIISADGEILAKTDSDEDGNEIRDYPYDNIFAHVVGYDSHGKGGLESEYNYDLLTSHTDIISQFTNGIQGNKNPGDNVITTLDTNLQEAAYDALGDYSGAIIAIEPSTGKIRAMVSKPDFNPNDLNDIWSDIVEDESSSILLNRCTQGLYPPGSTYKVITALEYINERPYSYDDFNYNCEGETIVDSVKIHCYENKAHGEETLEESFAHSCNTAFVTLGSDLNRKQFIELNKTLLFNQKISCDLTVKQSRFNINMKTEQSQLPQTVIGQGDTLMTPLHNALIMCAMAEDGVMMRPMLVEKVESSDHVSVKDYKTKKLLELDDKDSIAQIQKMLRSVVTDGTGTALQDEDYTVAGKTGTAENEKEDAHSWFVGYSNVDDPDLVVCVIAENTGAGSKYAAPMAKEVFDAYYDNNLNEVYR